MIAVSPAFARALGTCLRAAIFIGGVAVARSGFAEGTAQAGIFFAENAYLIVAALVVWALILAERARDSGAVRVPAAAVAAAVAASALVFFCVRPEVRIFNDEMKLISVSKILHQKREARFERMRFVKDGEVQAAYGVDKRPLLFPFLTHVVHSASGYRPENAFAVNFALLSALFALIIAVFLKYSGPAAALTALALTASQPALAFTAASAGAELLFIVLALSAAVALIRFGKSGSGASFEAALALLILIAHVRRDGFVFLPVVLGALALFGRIGPRRLAASWTFAFAPFFLSPVIWQRVAFWKDPQAPRDGRIFGLDHFFANNEAFFQSMFAFGPEIPYAGIVNVLGSAALLYFYARFEARFREIPAGVRASAFACAAAAAAYWALVTSYWWGHPLDYWVIRLYVFFCVVLSLAAASLVVRFARRPRARIGAAAAACAVFALYFSIAASEPAFAAPRGLKKRHDVSMKFLSARSAENFLVINDNASVYAVHGFNAVTANHVRGREKRIEAELAAGVYDAVYVVESVRPRAPANANPSRLALDRLPVFEEAVSPGETLRISAVKEKTHAR